MCQRRFILTRTSCCDDGLVAGIIFVHDITEDRANVYADTHAWPIKYFDSPAVLQHLVLATSKWDLDVAKRNLRKQEEREQDLREMPAWRRLLSRGASMCRYEGDHDTAWNAIDKLLKMPALRVANMRRDLNTLHSKMPHLQRPKRALERMARMFSDLSLARAFSDLAPSFDFLSITRTVDDEGRKKVTVVTAGSLDILSGAQNFRIETVTVTSAGRDFITQNITTHNYHFHGPVTVVVGSDAAAKRLLRGLPGAGGSS